MTLNRGSAVEVSIAAAVAVLDFNLLSNSPHRQSSMPRTLKAAALRGSAAAGDTAVSILINQTEVARIFNTTTGFPNRDDLVRIGAAIPTNAEVSAVIVDAPATNPINLLMEFGPG